MIQSCARCLLVLLVLLVLVLLVPVFALLAPVLAFFIIVFYIRAMPPPVATTNDLAMVKFSHHIRPDHSFVPRNRVHDPIPCENKKRALARKSRNHMLVESLPSLDRSAERDL